MKTLIFVTALFCASVNLSFAAATASSSNGQVVKNGCKQSAETLLRQHTPKPVQPAQTGTSTSTRQISSN